MTGMTPEERSAAVSELEASRRRLLASIAGLSEEQWNRRPSPDRWSIAECAEHVTAAEMPLAKFFAAAATVRPSEEERREIREKDDFVRLLLRDRSARGESPERIRPKGRFATREETVRIFEERRAANLAYVRATSEPLRDRFAPHPFAGVIDGYQWLLHLAAHTDRHAAQIREIRSQLLSSPRFPVVILSAAKDLLWSVRVRLSSSGQALSEAKDLLPSDSGRSRSFVALLLRMTVRGDYPTGVTAAWSSSAVRMR